MRHDAHYVDELTQTTTTHVGRMLPTDKLDPNPDQPRTEIGDLTELTSSIREKGVLEPLLVKPLATGRWMIIAGERRWRAATAAGLQDVPCIEMDVDESGVAEIALIENMQRKDLTPWEEADGLRALCERFGYTHEEVARKVGKSRSTVTEALSIATLPESIREQCRRADIKSKSLILQIVRQPNEEAMRGLADNIISHHLTRDDARISRKEQSGTRRNAPSEKPSVYRYASPHKDFILEIKFRRRKAEKEDVLAALKSVMDNLA